MIEINHQEIGQKFFTIGIPTYNRADQLENILDSLIPLKTPWLDEGIVRLLISDNHSTDSTPKMVKNHSLSSYIDYYCNSENIGVWKNMLKIIHVFRSDYLIIICDDDIFLSENLHEVMNRLWLKKPDYAVVNSIAFNGLNVIPSKGNDDKDIQWLLFNHGAIVDKGIGYMGNVIFSQKIKAIEVSENDVSNFQSIWYSLKLFFQIYSSLSNGLLILTPLIKLVGAYSCGEIEDHFAIHSIDRLKGLKIIYNQGFINKTEYAIFVNQLLSRIGYQSLFPFFFGRFPQKTKQAINYLLKHYPGKIKGINKLMLLFMSKTPNVFQRLLRPLSIFFIYHIYYRYFSLKFLNLFRKNQKKDDLHASISTNAPKPTWKFNWKEIEE